MGAFSPGPRSVDCVARPLMLLTGSPHPNIHKIHAQTNHSDYLSMYEGGSDVHRPRRTPTRGSLEQLRKYHNELKYEMT